MSKKDIALEAAIAAGSILKNYFRGNFEVDSKGKHDIVTEADIASENKILKMLKKEFPKYNYLAEESGSSYVGSDYTWYIDPLDGTSNFVTGIPYFSVSIALGYLNEVVFGVVYNPISEDLYFAEKGWGAFLNNEQIKVSNNSELSLAILASAYSANENDSKNGLKAIKSMALQSRKVLVNFSPALDLCGIAKGKLDGLVDNGTTPEDHAAGSLILSEAGGSIENYDDENWNVNSVGLIASNGKLQNDIRKLIEN